MASKEWISKVKNDFKGVNANIIEPDKFTKIRDKKVRDQITYLFVGTGGTEHIINSFLLKAKLPSPIFFLSHDGNNSLSAAIEIRTHLKQQGTAVRIIHDSMKNLLEKIQEWNTFIDIIEKLKQSQIGVFGKSSPWLMASEINRSAVKRKWGVSFKNYSLKEIFEKTDDDLWEEFKPNLNHFIREATEVDCSEEDLKKAAIVAQTLSALVKTHELDAISVECFKLFEEKGITGCYALSYLNTLDTICAACEGDLPTTFTLMLAKYLTNKPGFMANVVDVNPDTNSVTFAHCSVPTNMLESYDITSHFETSKSVAIRGRFPFRDITVFKVFGKDLSDYWVSEGVITKNLNEEFQCRTQIRATLTGPVSYFLEQALGNHHVIIPGKFRRRILEFFQFITK